MTSISREATDSSGTTSFPVPDAGHNLRGKPADPNDELAPVDFHDHDDHADAGHDHNPYRTGAPMVFDPEPVVTGPVYHRTGSGDHAQEYSRFTVQLVSGFWTYQHRVWGEWKRPEPEVIVPVGNFRREDYDRQQVRLVWHRMPDGVTAAGKTIYNWQVDIPRVITEAVLMIAVDGVVPWCSPLSGLPAPAPEPAGEM